MEWKEKMLKKNDACWIIENGNRVTSAEIKACSGNLYLIKLASGTVLRVPRHRLYDSMEAAEAALPKQKHERKYRSPYDYM